MDFSEIFDSFFRSTNRQVIFYSNILRVGDFRYQFHRQLSRICVSVVGLCSRIFGDLNWSIARVCKVRPKSGQSRLGLLQCELVDDKGF